MLPDALISSLGYLWNDSLKLNCLFKILRFHESATVMVTKVFCHPKLVYSMKTCSWSPLCVLWYSCFIPRLNFLVSYSSDPSPGIFFVCKHAGRSKDPRCENWNCQLLARFLHPGKWRFKLFSESSWSSATKAALVWVINGSTSGSESLDTARLFRLFLAFTALGQRTQIT